MRRPPARPDLSLTGPERAAVDLSAVALEIFCHATKLTVGFELES